MYVEKQGNTVIPIAPSSDNIFPEAISNLSIKLFLANDTLPLPDSQIPFTIPRHRHFFPCQHLLPWKIFLVNATACRTVTSAGCMRALPNVAQSVGPLTVFDADNCINIR